MPPTMPSRGLKVRSATSAPPGTRMVVPDRLAVKCGNFLGEAMDGAAALGFRRVLVAGHLGKLGKLAGGVVDTLPFPFLLQPGQQSLRPTGAEDDPLPRQVGYGPGPPWKNAMTPPPGR